jgi:hypothetical protein
VSVRAIGSAFAAFACKSGDQIEIDMQVHLQKLVEQTGDSWRVARQEVFALQVVVSAEQRQHY